MLGSWKEGTITAQGALGHPATVPGWETALRGAHGWGEDMMQIH
jgi:hypothetical protein